MGNENDKAIRSPYEYVREGKAHAPPKREPEPKSNEKKTKQQ